MKITRKAFAATTAGLMLVAGLAGCSKNEPAEPTADKTTAAATETTAAADEATSEAPAAAEEEEQGAVKVNARPNECGLQEQAGPEASFGPFDGAIHFFQPGEMAPNPNDDPSMKMLGYKESQMHLELDLKANLYGTNWGYSLDETPANLHVMYQLSDANGDVKAKGMFMEMNAIDGSHYGTNLPKNTITTPGKYKMKITLYPPKNYDMHADYITGVPAEKWFGPLTADMDWDITQENLDIVKQNTVEDFMNPSEKCKAYPKKMYEDPTAEKAMKDAEAMAPVPMSM